MTDLWEEICRRSSQNNKKKKQKTSKKTYCIKNTYLNFKTYKNSFFLCEKEDLKISHCAVGGTAN